MCVTHQHSKISTVSPLRKETQSRDLYKTLFFFFSNLMCWSFCKRCRIPLTVTTLAKGFLFLAQIKYRWLYRPVADRTEDSLIQKERQGRLTDSLVLNPSREEAPTAQQSGPLLGVRSSLSVFLPSFSPHAFLLLRSLSTQAIDLSCLLQHAEYERRKGVSPLTDRALPWQSVNIPTSRVRNVYCVDLICGLRSKTRPLPRLPQTGNARLISK